jgi:hypothetical protein
MAELMAGERVRMWLRVTQGGSAPFPVATGVTEDGRNVTLPATYPGPFWRGVRRGDRGHPGPGLRPARAHALRRALKRTFACARNVAANPGSSGIFLAETPASEI